MYDWVNIVIICFIYFYLLFPMEKNTQGFNFSFTIFGTTTYVLP